MMKKAITINLESLLSLSGQLNATNDYKTILNLTLLSLMGKLRITRAAVYIPDDNSLKLLHHKGKTATDIIDDIDIKEICLNKNYDSLKSVGYDICLPIKYNDELFAVVALGQKIDKKDLKEDEFYYTSLVSTIAGNALNNAKNLKLLLNEKNKVERHNQLLKTLYEVSRDLNLFVTSDKIIKTLSFNLLGQLMITRFCVVSISGDKGKKEKITILRNTFKTNPPVEYIFELQDITDIARRENLNLSKKGIIKWFDENSVMVISPMSVQNKVKGYLFIGQKQNQKDFNDEELMFIKMLGNNALLSLENLKMIEIELKRRQFEKEMQIALEIQSKLLPKRMPNLPGLDIFGYTKPSRFVGGDYFDLIQLDKDRLMIAIADVSGKGMPASLLMANVQAALRTLASLDLDLIIIINMLNKLVYDNTGADKFITFFFGIFNCDDNTFEYINAGHNPPVLIKKNKIHYLKEGGLILGILEDEIDYEIGKISLFTGDRILFYTDGITEAMNSNEDEFGEDRLISILGNVDSISSEEMVQKIYKDVMEFCEHTEMLYDDITMIALRMT